MTSTQSDVAHGNIDAEQRILAAAARLIASGGPGAATTRAVAAEAGVQAPALYRLFGDKDGLLAAAAEYEFRRYVAEKDNREPHPDPIEDLKIGWDSHIAFCLANPGIFALLNDGAAGAAGSPAAKLGVEVLRRRIRRVAAAGRLTTTEDRALAAVHAAGVGAVMSLLRRPEAKRDDGFSRFMRDMVIAAIARSGPSEGGERERGPQAAAAQLNATLQDVGGLSPGERHLLEELLSRISRL